MTVAIIVIASCLALSIAGHVAQGLWLRTARREATDETARANSEHQRAIGLSINNAAHVKRIGELEQMLRETSAQRDSAVKQAIKDKAEEIRNAKTDVDALASLNGVLGQELPKAGRPTSGGDGR